MGFKRKGKQKARDPGYVSPSARPWISGLRPLLSSIFHFLLLASQSTSFFFPKMSYFPLGKISEETSPSSSGRRKRSALWPRAGIARGQVRKSLLFLREKK